MTDTTQAAGLTDDRQIIEMFSEHQRGIAAEFTGTTGVVTLDEAIRVVRAALAAQAAPAGWKLVPVEPTPEMLKAGDTKTWVLPALDCWRAMLSASPAPAEAKPCEGANCGSTDGMKHSPECIAETAQSQGWAEAKEEPKCCDRCRKGKTTLFRLCDHCDSLYPDAEMHPTPQPQAAQPVAWQVCWVSGGLRRQSKPFELENDARVYASMIMGNTEVRPLYDHAAPALTEERECDKADAQRYRWLRAKLVGPVPMVRVQIMKRGQYLLQTVAGLDEAVDALRSTQGGQT